MNYKIGDYVRFINEKQEGVVTRIIDHQLVGVTIGGDFEIPVLGNEIVLVNTSEKQLTQDGSEEEHTYAPAKTPGKFSESGVYFAISKDQNVSALFHQHLINETDYELAFQVFSEKEGIFKGILSGQLQPRSHVKTGSFAPSDLGQQMTYHFQILFFLPGEFTPKQPLVLRKEIKSKYILTSEKEIPQLHTRGHYIQLDEGSIGFIDTEELKERFFPAREEERAIHMPAKEVDLHIEELTEDFSKLSPAEIMAFQLENFRRSLEAAIAHNYANIIFIHGVGNGTLRNELHKRLGKHPHVKTFKDARKEKFGYGATEVILK